MLVTISSQLPKYLNHSPLNPKNYQLIL